MGWVRHVFCSPFLGEGYEWQEDPDEHDIAEYPGWDKYFVALYWGRAMNGEKSLMSMASLSPQGGVCIDVV